MNRLAESIEKFKWLIIIAVIGLTVFFSYEAKDLHINSDIISSLPDDDPAARLYKEIGTQFGGNDMGMIVLETDDVFKAEVIQHIKQITDSIKYTNGVSTVTSLTNILDIKSSEWGIEIGKLVDEYDLPVEQSQLDSLKNYVFSKEMYRGAVVSEDGTATAIMFTLLPEGDKQAVAKEIKDKIEALDLPETLYFGGLPIMMNDINDLIVADMVWLIPIVFIVIAIILLLSFKSFRGVLLPLLTAGLAVIWTIGLMTVTGYELTIISNIIPVVLLAVGSAYTIHVLNSINHNKLADRKKALIQSLGYILVPVILAAVTTAIGFVSFVFGAYLTMIKDFGIFTAVGTLIALMLSLFFVPALISGLSMYSKKNVTENKEKQTILTHKILLPLVNFLFKHPKYTLTGWGVLLMLCIGGITLIKTSVNMADYFKKDNPTRVAEDVLQKKFGGSLPVFVVFEGDMQSPEVLKMMISTEDFMKEDPNIEITQSVADLIEQMNDAMGEGKKFPTTRQKLNNYGFCSMGRRLCPNS